MAKRVLILGGTGEARELAGALASRDGWDITLSLAGRTKSPAPQPTAVRVGGFGGADGLAAHLRSNGINVLIDATHPYAERISANAASAASATKVPILALRRPAWQAVPGDRWTLVENVKAAIVALGNDGKKVFLALGRQEIAPFAAAPQHSYLIRSVDPVEPPLAVPDATYLFGRGPFAQADEAELLRAHGIEAIVAKNSGGASTYGKIAAARDLGIPVFLLERPRLPNVPGASTVDDILAMLDHEAAAENRGV